MFRDFNVLVFGDFTADSSDVQGRLAAGGNVSLDHYSVGDKLSGDLIGGDTLIAGGDIVFPSGRVYYGNIVAGGSAAGVGSAVRNGLAPYGLYEGLPPPLDFTAERNRLLGASAALGAMTPTGSDEYKWSQLFLSGSGAGVEVFEVAASDLARATNIVITGVEEGANVIINVLGANAAMSGGMDSFFERNRESVLFNFVDATILSLSNIGVQGSILAPQADITTGWGVIWGQVAAASWNGPMQVNAVYYDGMPLTDTINEVASIPAPTGLVLFLTGLAVYGARRRIAG